MTDRFKQLPREPSYQDLAAEHFIAQEEGELGR